MRNFIYRQANALWQKLSVVHVELWVAAFFIVVLSILRFGGGLERMEYSMYDIRFRLKTPPPVSEKIVVLAIDDESLKSVGRWPWRRSVHAGALDLLKRFGVSQVVFDVEFTEKSGRTLNKEDQKRIPGEIRRKMDELSGLVLGLLNMAAAPAPVNWKSVLGDLQGHIRDRKRALLSMVGSVGQDDDLVFSRAIHRMGHVVLPVRDQVERIPESPRLEYVLNRYFFKPGKGQSVGGIRRVKWLDIPSNPLHRAPEQLAFTTVDKDRDGVRRRIALFRLYKNRLIPQLAFAGVLKRLKVAWKDVLIEPGYAVTLKNATVPGRKDKRTIVIPVDDRCQMLVNWAGHWKRAFHQISYKEIFAFAKDQQTRRADLTEMDRAIFSGQMGLDMINNQLTALEQKRASGQALSPEEVKGMVTLQTAFRSVVTNELSTLSAEIDKRRKQLPKLAGEEKAKINKEIAFFDKYFKLFSGIWKDYLQDRANIAGKLSGATVIIGQTASSTTDLGTTPVDTDSPQVFLHANVFNGILKGSFVRRAAPLIDFLFIVLVTFLFAFLAQNMAPSHIIVLGFSILGGYAVVNTLVFSLGGVWLDFAAVQLSLGATFATITSLRYLAGDREKKYIKTAFQHYVAAEVVEDLVAGRANLKLGGERKVITAFFSDVQGFSSISEKLKPDELVDLLNDYLTDMTDIVMAHKGTVDKFEGDAVIAMYGAPVYYEDHAVRACIACLDQQAKIAEKNPYWKEKFGTELFVRMGVNTGPMVVGNMGSRNRFDYTMMGDAVNLAARLEGVNKYYRTGIMISQFTYEAAGDAVVGREIDRLRVVGKKESVTVYELLGRKGSLSAAVEEKLALFDGALVLYKQKRWAEARDAFRSLMERFPEDGPSEVYRDRCAEFLKKPPAGDWDGVYILRSK